MKKLEKFKLNEVNPQNVRGGTNIDYSYQYFTTYVNDEARHDKRVDDICVSW